MGSFVAHLATGLFFLFTGLLAIYHELYTLAVRSLPPTSQSRPKKLTAWTNAMVSLPVVMLAIVCGVVAWFAIKSFVEDVTAVIVVIGAVLLVGALACLDRSCLHKSTTPFVYVTPYPSSTCVVILACILQILGEAFVHSYPQIQNIQHMMILSGYAVAGVAELAERCSWLPSHSTGALLFVATLSQAVLFVGHTPDNPLEQRYHSFIFACITSLLVVTLLTTVHTTTSQNRDCHMRSLFGLLCMLEGSTFVLTGLHVFGPGRPANQVYSHKDLMWVNMFFSSAILTLAVLYSATKAFASCVASHSPRSKEHMYMQYDRAALSEEDDSAIEMGSI